MIQDLKEYKVKNWLIMLGLICSVICLDRPVWKNVFPNWIFGVLTPIIICFPIFSLGAMGAADIKLISIIGGFYTISFSIKVLFLSILIGGILSIGKMWYYKSFYQRIKYFIHYIKYFDRKNPYYDSERDGKKCVIHFTIPILVSTLISKYIWFV